MHKGSENPDYDLNPGINPGIEFLLYKVGKMYMNICKTVVGRSYFWYFCPKKGQNSLILIPIPGFKLNRDWQSWLRSLFSWSRSDHDHFFKKWSRFDHRSLFQKVISITDHFFKMWSRSFSDPFLIRIFLKKSQKFWNWRFWPISKFFGNVF